MNTSKNRRLVTILFADIVGYTTLMEQNESIALATLKKFKENSTEKVVNYDGEIIQFFGDGCLCVFHKSVDAVRCANELQIAFSQSPEVPVRIGIHLGEVVFEEDNVFGDAVNIASRIESMGIAGAVLMSSHIRHQIKDYPALVVEPLGRFKFKNSKKEMSLYALATEGCKVPKVEEMQGKGKQIDSLTPLKMKVLTGVFGFFSVAIASLLFFQYGTSTTASVQPITSTIQEQRIAVLPFKNNTNESDLDILGDMAADWINQGLMSIETAEVVSPYTVRSHKAAIGITENDPQGRPSFAQLTGARNIISGNYYLEKEELLFKLELFDALNGKLRYGFEPIRGAAADKEALITKLRSVITGYWLAKDLVDAEIIKAPNLEAYQLYTEAIQNQDITNEKLLKILALDSTFYLPRIHFLNSNRFNLADRSHFEFLHRHQQRLNIYEKGWYEFLVNYYAANKLVAFESLDRIRKKYPHDFILNQETASVAMELLYNPELAIAIYDELDISNISPASAGVHYNWRIQNYATSLHLLERQEDLADFCENTAPNESAWLVPYFNALLFPAVNQQDLAELKNITTRYKSSDSFNPFYYWLRVFGFARKANNTAAINEFWQAELNWLASILDAATPFAKTVKMEAEILSQKTLSYQPTKQVIDKQALIFEEACYLPALYAIEKGDKEQAKMTIQKYLDYLKTDNYPISSPYKYGFRYYDIGVLYAIMGDQTSALTFLQKAIDAGMTLNGTEFTRDGRLKTLYDLPAFKKMIQPIWPERLQN